MKLAETLERLGAGNAYCSWVGERPLEEVYASASAAEWAPWLQTWLWLAVRVGVAPRRVVEATCACARAFLKYVVPGAERGNPSYAAVELAERWVHGVSLLPQQLREVESYAHAFALGLCATRSGAAQAAAAHVAPCALSAVRTAQPPGSANDATCTAIVVTYMREAAQLNDVPVAELEALLNAVKVVLPYRVVSAALQECLAGREAPAGAPS